MLNALTQQDQLRQRVSLHFTNSIVVGGQPLNNNPGILVRAIPANNRSQFAWQLPHDAFRSHSHPGMGEYLNMRGKLGVSRANPTPNENYAREIMCSYSQSEWTR